MNKKEQKAALKALRRVTADTVTTPIEEVVTAGSGFTVPGAYRTGPWSLATVDSVEFAGVLSIIRTQFDAGPVQPRLDLQLKQGDSERIFRRQWGGIRAFLVHAEMDEDAREAGLAAASRPDKPGAIAAVIEALSSIEDAVVDVRFDKRGWPRYAALALDTDVDGYIPRGMTIEEAQALRDAADDDGGKKKKKGKKGKKARDYDDDDDAGDYDEVPF